MGEETTVENELLTHPRRSILLLRKMIKKKNTENKQLIAKFRRQFIYKPSTCILLCLLICEFGTIQLAYRRIPNEEKVLTPGRYVVWSRCERHEERTRR